MNSITFIISLLILSSTTSFAQGHSGVGGGDQCKNEIDKDRAEILAWIGRDDAKDLDFSIAKIQGQTYASYRALMLPVLQERKVVVTCYLDPARIADPVAQEIARTEGVSYRAVVANGSPSACINYEDGAGVSHIDCNYDSVMNEHTLGNPNYINTHHEFATIAGVEMRESQPSDFSISNQLSEFERIVQMKLLGPKVSANSDYDGDERPKDSDYSYVSYRIHSNADTKSSYYVSTRNQDRAVSITEVFLNGLGLAKETRNDKTADLEIMIELRSFGGDEIGINFSICNGRKELYPSFECKNEKDILFTMHLSQKKTFQQDVDLRPVFTAATSKINHFQDDLTSKNAGIFNPRKNKERNEIEFQKDIAEISNDTSPSLARYLYEVVFKGSPVSRPSKSTALRNGFLNCAPSSKGQYRCGKVKEPAMAKAIYFGPMKAIAAYYLNLGDSDGVNRYAQVLCSKTKTRTGFKYKCEFDHE